MVDPGTIARVFFLLALFYASPPDKRKRYRIPQIRPSALKMGRLISN